MKKIILFTSLCLFVFSVYAQTIEWPVFKGSNCNYVKILKIELTDTATVVDFRGHFALGNWISIPPDTYIQNSAGGEQFYCTVIAHFKNDSNHD